jgi:hypothetical protein
MEVTAHWMVQQIAEVLPGKDFFFSENKKYPALSVDMYLCTFSENFIFK